MTLYQLLQPLETILSESVSDSCLQLEIEHIATDLRDIKPQSLFVAIAGSRFNTHRLLNQLNPQEVRAVVYEDIQFKSDIPKGIIGIQVTKSRQALALLAHELAGQPTKALKLYGVTGTNGKTSVSFMLQHLLQARGYPTACIGTLGHFFNGDRFPTENTTPGPLELIKRLKEFQKMGAQAVVMEVSSHALDQFRVEGCHFDGVIFTNLTLDHLDYHQTMEQYFAAKSRLFTDFISYSCKSSITAVLNIDDSWIQKLKLDHKAQLVRYGQSELADIQYQIKLSDFMQTQVEVTINGDSQLVTMPLFGLFNVQNFLSSAAIMLSLGNDWTTIQHDFSTFKGVPGRLQRVEVNLKSAPMVLIDYAHTPDALENILKTLNEVRATATQSDPGQIKILFGCGGDRDTSKRPLMAKVTESYADQVYVTSDNPRFEDPQQIIDQIMLGFNQPDKVVVVADRKEAIQKIIKQANSNDLIVIAGKGHEDYQEIQGVRYPFNDYEIAKKILEAP